MTLQSRPDRIFHPDRSPSEAAGTNLYNDRVHYDSRLRVSFYVTKDSDGRKHVNEDTLVVAVHGISTSDKASYSVYFGFNSIHNEASLLPESAPQTRSGDGRYFAMLIALAKIARCLHSGLRSFPIPNRNPEAYVPPIHYKDGSVWDVPTVPIKTIVIVSDYAFLANAMCKHIRGSWSGGWKTHGFYNNYGHLIPQEPYLRNIDNWICWLENNGVKVQFWTSRAISVPRNMAWTELERNISLHGRMYVPGRYEQKSCPISMLLN